MDMYGKDSGVGLEMVSVHVIGSVVLVLNGLKKVSVCTQLG